MADKAIRQAVVDYVEGMTFGDEARLRSAFHPDAAIVGHYNGALEWQSIDQFVAEVAASGVNAAGPGPTYEVLSIDVAGDAASAKVSNLYAGARFTDYLSLLQHDGRWTIVNKLYHQHG